MIQETAIANLKAELARQVAHDIRSPLAALNALLSNSSALPEQERLILRTAAGRIRDIANNLLAANQPRPLREGKSVELLQSLIESLVSEKRLQFRMMNEVEIELALRPGTYGSFAEVSPADFMRMLSNLVDNAVEALDGRGRVTIVVEACKDHVTLLIKGERTAETVRLPRAVSPRWFLPELKLRPNTTLAILDDDASIHELWKHRFDAVGASRHGIRLRHFASPEEFRAWKTASDEEAVHLLDFELAGTRQSGLDIAEELGICAQSVLVSSHLDEEALRKRCESLGVLSLPKDQAPFVPISF